MDFAETSALSNSKVEAVFRRMILTVAPVIPDISAHLGLTDLPDGWIHVSRTDSGSVSGSPKPNNDVESNDAHLAVPTEDNDEGGGGGEQFMNYWTGEITQTEPATPAESGMIVNADPRQSTVSSSFYQRTSLHMSDKEDLRDMHIAGAGSDEDVDFDNSLKGKCSNCNIL
jgi:hypothetical protein